MTARAASLPATARSWLKSSGLGRAALLPYRAWVAMRHEWPRLRGLALWLARSREFTNFTYDLSPLNRAYLAQFLALATGEAAERFEGLFAEIETDAEFSEHVRRWSSEPANRGFCDPAARLGRRLGWYALVRHAKPRLVVETGVDKGLGACVLAAALLRNAAEGCPGRYVGTDINPRAGTLLRGRYASAGSVAVGDSIQSLERLAGPVDLFINDSDHSEDYEAREYRAIEPLLAPDAIVIGDNSHWSPKLLEFARATGREFAFFQECPQDHWYPGAGIGLAFRRAR
jgi:predicted O-methyltransferase YrrM